MFRFGDMYMMRSRYASLLFLVATISRIIEGNGRSTGQLYFGAREASFWKPRRVGHSLDEAFNPERAITVGPQKWTGGDGGASLLLEHPQLGSRILYAYGDTFVGSLISRPLGNDAIPWGTMSQRRLEDVTTATNSFALYDTSTDSVEYYVAQDSQGNVVDWLQVPQASGAWPVSLLPLAQGRALALCNSFDGTFSLLFDSVVVLSPNTTKDQQPYVQTASFTLPKSWTGYVRETDNPLQTWPLIAEGGIKWTDGGVKDPNSDIAYLQGTPNGGAADGKTMPLFLARGLVEDLAQGHFAKWQMYSTAGWIPHDEVMTLEDVKWGLSRPRLEAVRSLPPFNNVGQPQVLDLKLGAQRQAYWVMAYKSVLNGEREVYMQASPYNSTAGFPLSDDMWAFRDVLVNTFEVPAGEDSTLRSYYLPEIHAGLCEADKLVLSISTNMADDNLHFLPYYELTYLPRFIVVPAKALIKNISVVPDQEFLSASK